MQLSMYLYGSNYGKALFVRKTFKLLSVDDNRIS